MTYSSKTRGVRKVQAGEGGAKRARRHPERTRNRGSGRRTSATPALSALRAAGRSSSRRRGSRAKPSSRSNYGKGIDADGVLARGQFALNVVDREVALAQSHHLFADRIAGRGGVRTREGAEEGDGRGFRCMGGMADCVDFTGPSDAAGRKPAATRAWTKNTGKNCFRT